MKAVLVIILSLISITLANNPWGGAGVCVRFANQWSGEQLTSSWSKHDKDRRHVSTSSGVGENWVISKDELFRTPEGTKKVLCSLNLDNFIFFHTTILHPNTTYNFFVTQLL
uniref:Putative 10.7 kDa basic salivary protein n=1 Tax=Culex quinquefasciatus TaxID=7176 RepID=Q6TS04_CULQU|nr:putative 10.7 kDa basic salivary protein [Culex quinquefasciatus]